LYGLSVAYNNRNSHNQRTAPAPRKEKKNMSNLLLPDLSLDGWRATRDTVQAYAEVLSGVRKALAPREKHWWHISLRVAAAGLTTTPLVAGGSVVELLLNLVSHRLQIVTNRGKRAEIELHGQSATDFCDQVLRTLTSFGIRPAVDRAAYSGLGAETYDKAAVAHYWQVLPQVDGALKRLRSEHRGESGEVQFWPHHFDVAVLLFTGRRVPGADPADEESADENMNFGFLPGDDGIPEPYFYATAYPTPAGITESPLPHGAYWHTEGWTGAVLSYGKLRAQPRPVERLLDYLRAARDAAVACMT
jgi:Family of unknown function (DUF5996)